MKDYIFFIPPAEVVEKKARDWSNKEAKLYFDWLMSVKEDRIEYMLTVLDETLTENSEADIQRIGEKITQLLFTFPFSDKLENEYAITNKGLALVVDLSLLISKLIIEHYPQIKWCIVKRPKRDFSYNLPALFGFPIIEYRDPIGAAVSNAKAILQREKDSSIWLTMYKSVTSTLTNVEP
jgi:hypothetical protein